METYETPLDPPLNERLLKNKCLRASNIYIIIGIVFVGIK